MFGGVGLGVTLAGFETDTDRPAPLVSLPHASDWDIQVHSRDANTWADDRLTPMQAEHGPGCAGPPATHTVNTYGGAVFVCNNHVMTAINEDGYGQIVLTPAQILDFSHGGALSFELSTARPSTRDWPDVWITPWADNLTLPFDKGDVDQQGIPKNGIHLSLDNAQSVWVVSTVANGVQAAPLNSVADTAPFSAGIAAGVNQAAVRQTFKLTVQPDHIRFERLQSSSAPPAIYVDKDIPTLAFTSGIVQFGHHSYSPTKDGAGKPATWHWDEMNLAPFEPFTIIKTHTRALFKEGAIVFDAPAPPNSWLRFSAVGRIEYSFNGSAWQHATKQAFVGHPEHKSPYFIAVPTGMQSVSIRFSPDDWYKGPYVAQDFAIWSSSAPSVSSGGLAALSVQMPNAFG
jgi:hypothetical protein